MWPFDFKRKAEKLAYVRQTVRTLHPMDIIASRDNSPVSWWIRVKTDSRFSHVFVAGVRGRVYSVNWQIQDLDAIDFLKGKSFTVYRVPGLTPEQLQQGIAACQSSLGGIYPLADILVMDIQNYLDPGSPRLKFHAKGKICSEFVTWLYRDVMKVAFLPQKQKDESMMTPQDCTEQPGASIIATWND